METTAQIVEHYGRRFVVRLADKQRLEATTRKKRVDYACGDEVKITVLNDEQAVIEDYLPRKSLLFRQDAYRTKLIAANVTQILFITASEPSPNELLLQRALLAAELGQIKFVIVVNKTDLTGADILLNKLQFYADLDYELLPVSALEDCSILRAKLQGDSNIFIGQSGMGKSTLTNAILGGDYAKVGDISQALNSGKHTTTHARLYDLDEETTLIDSPGLQTFGVHQVAAENLLHYFPDMRYLIGQCRFHNCSHRQEPGCAVKDAVAKQEVAEFRLAFLQAITDELEQRIAYK